MERYDSAMTHLSQFAEKLHQGRFDIVSGKPLSPPVCVKLKTYPVRVDGRSVLIGLPAAGAIDAAKGAT